MRYYRYTLESKPVPRWRRDFMHNDIVEHSEHSTALPAKGAAFFQCFGYDVAAFTMEYPTGFKVMFPHTRWIDQWVFPIRDGEIKR